LYYERLRLLLGDYDIAKKSYRLESQRQLLELLARKLSYKMHLTHKRHASPSELNNYAISSLQDKYNRKAIDLALKELIYHCNILIPMTPEGNLGFGHLRYQEYLVACEIVHNRGVKVESFLPDSWWRGALAVYSQMADDVEHLIEWIAINDDFSRCKNNMFAMIDTRPEHEKLRLYDLYQKHLNVADI
jgi:hypothetical protein